MTGLAVGARVERAPGDVGTVVEAESDRVRVQWDHGAGPKRPLEWLVLAMVRPLSDSTAAVLPTIPEILAAYETMTGENVLALREGLPRVALEWTAQVGTGDMCRPWSVEDRPRQLSGRLDPRPTCDGNVAARVLHLTGDDTPADGRPYEAQIDHEEWTPPRYATQAEAMFACDAGLRGLRVALCGPYLVPALPVILTKSGRAKLAEALAAEGEVPS